MSGKDLIRPSNEISSSSETRTTKDPALKFIVQILRGRSHFDEALCDEITRLDRFEDLYQIFDKKKYKILLQSVLGKMILENFK